VLHQGAPSVPAKVSVQGGHGSRLHLPFRVNWRAELSQDKRVLPMFSWEANMPVILWLLGVPRGLVIVLWLLHVI
jgi:hypothetical protein